MDASVPAPLVEVATIGRAHGLDGGVLIRALSNHPERFTAGSELIADGRQLVVRRAHRHGQKWILHFEGIGDRAAAESLRGLVLRADAVVDDPDSYWVHDLIGAAIEHPDGRAAGTVVSVQENPASDLLVLEDGTLVPLRFAEWAGPGRLIVDGPEGLLPEPEGDVAESS